MWLSKRQRAVGLDECGLTTGDNGAERARQEDGLWAAWAVPDGGYFGGAVGGLWAAEVDVAAAGGEVLAVERRVDVVCEESEGAVVQR